MSCHGSHRRSEHPQSLDLNLIIEALEFSVGTPLFRNILGNTYAPHGLAMLVDVDTTHAPQPSHSPVRPYRSVLDGEILT